MKGLTIMYDYRGKILGMVISALGLVAMIVERLTNAVFIKKWNPHQHYYLFFWVTLLGLACIAFSKEKHDDERAQAIRLKATQYAFLILLSTIMSIGLMAELIGVQEMPLEGSILLGLAGASLVLYLLVFHVGLYRDDVWDYDNKGLWYNLSHISKNRWGLLAYFVICAVALVLLNLVWI